MNRTTITALILSAGGATLTVGAGLGSPDHHGEPARAGSPLAEPARTAPASKPASTPAPKPADDAPKAPKPAPAASSAAEASPRTPDEALRLLAEGNARWVADSEQNPNTEPARRRQTAEAGQTPFVTILTCADSRLPVERIFDRGVGDLFVVRVAGNVVSSTEAGTIEYGLEHLHTKLLVVMGHHKCGAVKAAIGAAGSKEPAPGNIGALISEIAPAVERAKNANPAADGEELLAAAVRENVWQSVFDLLKTSPATLEMVKSGGVRVVGAVCDLATGKVEMLGEHPWQSQLLEALGEAAPAKTAGASEPDEHHR